MVKQWVCISNTWKPPLVWRCHHRQGVCPTAIQISRYFKKNPGKMRTDVGMSTSKKKQTKIKHKIFPLFFPTLRLHRVTNVALRGIYICILFTAYFDVFTFTWSKRSAKNTVLRTNQNSKWVPDVRKRYSQMTPQFSVQYSTMQKILHSYDAEHTRVFFSLPGETEHDWINRRQSKERKRKEKTMSGLLLPVCTDWNTQSCSHRPLVHKPVRSLMREW